MKTILGSCQQISKKCGTRRRNRKTVVGVSQDFAFQMCGEKKQLIKWHMVWEQPYVVETWWLKWLLVESCQLSKFQQVLFCQKWSVSLLDTEAFHEGCRMARTPSSKLINSFAGLHNCWSVFLQLSAFWDKGAEQDSTDLHHLRSLPYQDALRLS